MNLIFLHEQFIFHRHCKFVGPFFHTLLSSVFSFVVLSVKMTLGYICINIHEKKAENERKRKRMQSIKNKYRLCRVN